MRKAIGIGSFGAMAIVAMFLMSTVPMAGACDYTWSAEYSLKAGKKEIGATVKAWIEHDVIDYLYVKYTTTGNWFLTETHVAISIQNSCPDGVNPNSIPVKNGNPPPGQFPYKATHPANTQTYTYKIPLGTFHYGDYICIATHAVVVQKINGVTVQEQTGWAGDHDFTGKNWALFFCFRPSPIKRLVLPSSVTATISHPGTNSYWDVDVTGGGSGDLPIQNDWLGWCVDAITTINPGSHTFNVIPYYDTANIPLDEQSNNWNKINYVLNHKGGLNPVQLQNVIWYFSYDFAYGSLSPAEKVVADDADLNGGGFYPGSGQYMAVIIQFGTSQTIIIEIDP
jgi:hypothetical protein